jgi:hypothetical protein
MKVYERGSLAEKWTHNNTVKEALNSAFASSIAVCTFIAEYYLSIL